MQKQASGGSSDSSDDGYEYGVGRTNNLGSTPITTTHNSGLDGPMILKPSNPEYSDILLQEIARLSEQHRREVAASSSASSSNEPSTSANNLLNDQPSTSKDESSQASQASSSNATSNQQMELDNISNQYNTNSILPLRLPNNQMLRAQNLTEAEAISRANLMRAESSSHQSRPSAQFETNHHDLSFPMMLQRDSHSSCLAEYPIGSHKVVGFTVGGEPRLCLPQLKALILPDYNGVDKLISDLQIATVNASSDQLTQLIQANALPKSVGYCPLITRSNVERLINYCVIKGIRPLYGLGNVDQVLDSVIKQALQHEIIHIEHFCFGGQTGIYYPSLLSSACIECSDCQRLFRPPDFVRHTHTVEETDLKVCDWGFDAANWKFYIVLGNMVEDNGRTEERLQRLLAFPYDLTLPSPQPTAFNPIIQLGEASTSALLSQPQQEQPVKS